MISKALLKVFLGMIFNFRGLVRLVSLAWFCDLLVISKAFVCLSDGFLGIVFVFLGFLIKSETLDR